MVNFSFRNPVKILFGQGKIDELGKEIKRFGVKKVLFLAGGGSIMENGVYDSVVNSMKASGIEWQLLWGVRANPELDHARVAIDTIKEHELEAVVAVGGGSVIDEAKAVAAGFHLNDLWNAFEGKEVIKKALPIFTVLTLSATTSEMNSYAVLTHSAEKKKWAIGSQALYPKVSIIDPSVQTSLPWRQTANGGVDAISHLLENYVGGSDFEPTKAIIETLMKTVISSVDRLKEDESDLQARADFAWAVTLSLNGLTAPGMTGEWSVHTMEHSISAYFPDVAHGEGLSVMFPAWLTYAKDKKYEHFTRWAKNVWGVDTPEEGIAKLKDKFKSWGAPVSFKDLNIGEEYITKFAKNALLGGKVGVNWPLGLEELKEIYRLALH
jgi:alcohol dehydrogenase YqhD (iron-dependent ADH family)